MQKNHEWAHGNEKDFLSLQQHVIWRQEGRTASVQQDLHYENTNTLIEGSYFRYIDRYNVEKQRVGTPQRERFFVIATGSDMAL